MVPWRRAELVRHLPGPKPPRSVAPDTRFNGNVIGSKRRRCRPIERSRWTIRCWDGEATAPARSGRPTSTSPACPILPITGFVARP